MAERTVGKMVFYEKDVYKWWVLFTASLGAISVSLDSSILVVCLPTLARVFHTDSAVIGWVNIAYLTMNQSLGLTLARIGDAKGRKRVYMTGLAFYTIGIAACALAQGPYQLILARAIQGVGAATGWSLTMAIVVAVFPATERGKALGILAGAYSFGLVAGPVLGGLILDLLGWRAVFYLRVPVALLALIMAAVVIREQKSEETRVSPRCRRGCESLRLSFSPHALSQPRGKMGHREHVRARPGSHHHTLSAPLHPRRKKCRPAHHGHKAFQETTFHRRHCERGTPDGLDGNRNFPYPFLFVGILGFSAALVGLFIAILAVPVMVISPISGRVSDRIGSTFLAALGMAVILTALLFLGRLGPAPSYFEIGTVVSFWAQAWEYFSPPTTARSWARFRRRCSPRLPRS